MASPSLDAERIITVQELGHLVGVPVATIYRWRGTGKGPRGMRVGKYIRYRMSDVEAWLDSCTDGPP